MLTMTNIGRALLPLGLAVLTACGGGSGAETVQNNNPNAGGSSGGFVYTGPAPSTDDVQSFKINVWDNLVAEDRCGACHAGWRKLPLRGARPFRGGPRSG